VHPGTGVEAAGPDAARPQGSAGTQLVVLANRLPVDRVTLSDGSEGWARSPGGLVSALAPVMRQHDGAWIGWVGASDEAPEPFRSDSMDLVAVPLTRREVQEYYEGFSNASLWPLYHDVIVPAEFHREWWDTYVRVNRRFAAAAAEVAEPGAVVWVQDYQLQLVPLQLREMRPDLRIGFFLHIPFPPQELFAQLPWRRQIVSGLLGADLVGFQREGAVGNFLDIACRYTAARRVSSSQVALDGRKVAAGAFPISIDWSEVADLAHDPQVLARAAEIRDGLGSPEHVLLGVDRLDYTKGIRHRLKAWAELLEDGEVTPEHAVFVQVATPSRERVSAYQALRDEIELEVGHVNGEFGRIGMPAVHYLHATYDRRELVALYLAADVMVVTPLRDGMNLVAKEYVAARTDERGVVVLSEFAGAADQLSGAILVNPHDIDGLKAALLEAVYLPQHEQERRMRSMRTQVRTYDVARWADEFVTSLLACDRSV
jgi:trehalose 6-phosphate synthase